MQCYSSIYMYIYMYIYIYIYIYTRSICREQLFRSLRAHQYNSDKMKILKDQSAQTTATVVSVEYRLWVPFLINRVLNLTKLRGVIYVNIQSIYMYLYIYKQDILQAYVAFGYRPLSPFPKIIQSFTLIQNIQKSN